MAGSTSDEKPLREYKNIPVCIVEDHNHVLEHIYRSIASKHLPFCGVTMLHFDSHPDLQIATDMDADVVFDKSQLLSQLSIENWIMPALYAGHINKVIWVKPPWADQLPEETRHVSVGKHKDTGKLRVSWPDVYFLSDILYGPTDSLQNAKPVTIATVTMETDILKTESFQKVASTTSRTECTLVEDDDEFHLKAKRKKVETEDVEKSKEPVEDSENRTSGQRSNDKGTSAATSDGTETRKSSETTQLRTSNEDCTEYMPKLLASDNTISKGHPEVTGGHTEVVSKLLCKPFILDIDLDFFSTKNPFKDVYTKDQYQLLEDLYHFTPPADSSEAAIESCQQKRSAVLKELQAAVKACWDGIEPECAVDKDRFAKVKKLVASLQANPPADDQLDAELIHMAGLTCDDTGELPHHVSTAEEIESLLVAMKDMLSRLPKPTMVTIARSSHDDYCPTDQVDTIQIQVIQILQSVYGSVDVQIDYEITSSEDVK